MLKTGSDRRMLHTASNLLLKIDIPKQYPALIPALYWVQYFGDLLKAPRPCMLRRQSSYPQWCYVGIFQHLYDLPVALLPLPKITALKCRPTEAVYMINGKPLVLASIVTVSTCPRSQIEAAAVAAEQVKNVPYAKTALWDSAATPLKHERSISGRRFTSAPWVTNSFAISACCCIVAISNNDRPLLSCVFTSTPLLNSFFTAVISFFFTDSIIFCCCCISLVEGSIIAGSHALKTTNENNNSNTTTGIFNLKQASSDQRLHRETRHRWQSSRPKRHIGFVSCFSHCRLPLSSMAAHGCCRRRLRDA